MGSNTRFACTDVYDDCCLIKDLFIFTDFYDDYYDYDYEYYQGGYGGPPPMMRGRRGGGPPPVSIYFDWQGNLFLSLIWFNHNLKTHQVLKFDKFLYIFFIFKVIKAFIIEFVKHYFKDF